MNALLQAALDRDFGVIADFIRQHAQDQPEQPALIDSDQQLSYAELDAQMDRVAACLQRDGFQPGDVVAICALSSVRYATVFLGALRAGVVVAPLAPSSTSDSLQRMLDDAGAKLLFVDDSGVDSLGAAGAHIPRVAMAGTAGTSTRWEEWLSPEHTGWRGWLDRMRALGHTHDGPTPVTPEPDWPLNIIYSSGTTGEPKGIVQGHGMRWAHVRRGQVYGYGPGTATLLSTPLYSNTTLVVFFPTMAYGGCAVLMPKFDPLAYLELAQKHRITHTMLVPVQFQRLMAQTKFDGYDLSRFLFKFSTSAPFGAALKADVLKRWPGGLVEFYGTTEGGGTCILEAHKHPDKLHTVGQPAPGSEIRLIDEAGHEVAPGEAGEVVGRSGGMMAGYHGQPEKTREVEWFAPDGQRFIRTGDVGRFDADGFLTLIDRKKDVVISGGFNIYPSDLETVLREHPAVADAAVVGVPSTQWGETPVAFIVARPDAGASDDEILQWANARLGKTQRLAGLRRVNELPRSAIGKVLKRELRAAWGADGGAPA